MEVVQAEIITQLNMTVGSISDRRAASPDAPHRPVLVEEVLEYLSPEPSGIYVDATVGAGGHAMAILERVRLRVGSLVWTEMRQRLP